MADILDFTNRTILVTGAASGIGAACAHLLASCGAQRLVLVDRDEARLAALDLPCETARIAGDVADPALWQRMASALAGLDHAILNAGISAASPILETEFEEWRRVMSVNLDGAFLSLQASLRAMRDRGSIVLTASASGSKAEAGVAAYASSKAGVIQLARVAAKEAAPRGIRINAIAPGGVNTPMWDEMDFFAELLARHNGDREAALAAMAGAATPLGRFASAADIARQIAFLLCDCASLITGAVLVSDGGYSL